MAAADVLTGNGRYTVLLRPTGTGFSAWDGLALTDWSADPTTDGGGLTVYVRDLDRGRWWSVGHAPAGASAARYAWTGAIEREDDGIVTTMALRVPPDGDVELRRIVVTNRGAGRRRLDVTTYAEVVLHDPGAHAAHPAFAKLFVETEHDAERALLLARRRPRASGDRAPWLVHALAGPGSLEWDTDRALVLGRGFSRARPRMLASAAPLAATAGSVLDPVVCCRRTVTLDAGASAELVALLGAGDSAAAVRALATHWLAPPAVAAVFTADPPNASPSDLPPALQAAAASAHAPGRGTPTPARARPAAGASSPPPAATAALAFDNGHGGFSEAGDEYVVRVDPRRPDGPVGPPLPWVNVVANASVGFIASETGAGCTWSRNSREHRLTPWANDPILDPPGEAVWIRDEDASVFWSPQPAPTPAPAAYETRHGFGVSTWRHTSAELVQEVAGFVARTEPVKATRVRLTNTSDRPRRLAVVAYARLVLGVDPPLPGHTIVTDAGATPGLLLARNPDGGDFTDGIAFAAVLPPPGAEVSATTDRRAFLGAGGTLAAPAALADAITLDGRTGAHLDPCFGLQATFGLAPGATAECTFLLGETTSADDVHALVARWQAAGAVTAALDDVRADWAALLESVRVATPVPALDAVLNGWLLYQTVSCRLLGRSAFYQSGGAFGFRDQLQDATALVWARPDATREQIVLHAGHQFPEGDVLHWWHPPRDRGTRTRFSDDLLWLPWVAAFYVGATGDAGVLDEPAPFVTARLLAPGEDEAYAVAGRSAETASVYEHCCRAIDRSLTRGAHGLPLMGTGDWNDGMNRVGREGRGESVWLAFFLYDVLGAFAPLCARRGDRARADRYRRFRRSLRGAIERSAWDGEWYRRAWYDDGTPLGTAAGDECRIDALAQAWAVISGAAPRARAEQALDAVARLLVSEGAGLIRLLTPPFDRTPHDPGYIKGYVPGIRENGGQYTHAACWVVRAAAELGRRDEAARWLTMLSPVSHATTTAAAAAYRVEPYVVVADVYAVAPHVGRGGWTWYTGSAGWLFRVALESVLGLTLDGGRALRIAPRIPDAWPGFRVDLRLPDGATTYAVEVVNPGGRAAAVVDCTADGRRRAVRDGAARVPLRRDGKAHRVVVTLGAGGPAQATSSTLPVARS